MVRLWDAATGNPLGPPIVPSSSPQDAGFTDDGKTVLTLGRDGGIRLSDAQTGRQLGPPMAHSGPVVAVDIGPDNRFLLAVAAEGTVQLWDVATSRPIGPPSLSRSKVLGAILRPDGRSFVSAAEDGTTTLRTIPEPTPGDLATLALRFQVLTGRQLDQDQTLTGLTPDVWREHEGRLPEHGKRGP